MQTLFGLDLSTAQKVIIASVVILILLVLLGLFVRQIQGGRLKLKGQGGGRARQPRLGVVDAHNLDRQRQLILIRRDNVEHLIMIGGASDVVVETNILRSGARAATQPIDYASAERPQAFDSLVPQEPGRHEPSRQEPSRQDPVRHEPMRHEPVRAEPVAVAQPKPDLLPPLPTRPVQATPPSRPVQSQTQADAALAAVAAAAVPAALAAGSHSTSYSDEAATPTPTVNPPSFARDHAPSPAASAVELDSMARQLEEALKRPFSAVRSAHSQSDAPTAAKPVPAPEVTPVPVVPVAAEPEPAPAPPAPPEVSSRASAFPANVAAELEMALGLKPERVTPAPEVERPAWAPEPEPEPVAEPEPKAEEPAAEDHAMDADDLIAHPDEEPEAEAKIEPAPEPEPEMQEPEPHAALAVKPVEPPAKEPEQAPKPAAIDPFSVDAIEAEFARLLGRDPKPKS